MGEIVIQIYIIGFLFYCLYGLLPQTFNKKREKVIESQGNSNTDIVTMITVIIDAMLWPISILALLFLSKKR